MSASIDINGKNLLPIKEAISKVDYSRDYLTRLAREKKIVATQIGRMWYVDVDSVKNYHAVAQAEQEIKKRQLSDERKRELAFKEMKAQKQRRAKNRVRRKTPAIVGMCLVVALGVGLGIVLETQLRTSSASLAQLANVKTFALNDLNEVKETRLEVADFVEGSRQTVVPEFAPHVSHRDLSSPEGLLLLPVNASGTVEVQEYFSDPVTLSQDKDGQSVVQRLDKDGNPIGGDVPFVVVPINTNSP